MQTMTLGAFTVSRLCLGTMPASSQAGTPATPCQPAAASHGQTRTWKSRRKLL